MEEDGGGVTPTNPLPVGIFVRAAGSALGKNEPGLVVDELEDSLWPKMPPALVDLAVRGGRGEESGETLPKTGFDSWLVDLVSFLGVVFKVPASNEPFADVAIAGDVVEADVLGEVAELWMTVGSVWFNLATNAGTFSDVILTDIGTRGGFELAERGAVAATSGDKIPVPVEPSPRVWEDDKEAAVVVGFVEVGAASLPNGANGAPVPSPGLGVPNKPPVPNPGVGV